jgi:hypothetical protein
VAVRPHLSLPLRLYTSSAPNFPAAIFHGFARYPPKIMGNKSLRFVDTGIGQTDNRDAFFLDVFFYFTAYNSMRSCRN